MTMNRREFLSASCAALAVAACPGAAHAHTYPEGPVHVVVPFAPGGPNDLAGRIIADGLAERFGATFVVENVGGAGGNIGTGRAASAAPDGHTLLIAAPSFAINPTLYPSVPYDPEKSFDAVTLVASARTVLTVHPSIPASTVQELARLVASRPDDYSYASPGAGTPPHLLGELFRLSLGLDLVHVPFKSGGEAIASTVAGHTPVSFGALPPAVPHVKDGRLRALAITSSGRSPALPGVPAIGEAGYPDIAADIWTAVLVPAGTPSRIADLLQAEIREVLEVPAVRKRMAALGYDPIASTPEDCAEHIATEARRWAKVIQAAGIRLQ